MPGKLIYSIFILFFVSIRPGNAQDTSAIKLLEGQLKKFESDKLKAGNKSELFDTVKVFILDKLSRAYWTNDPDRSMTYAAEIERISEKISFKKGLGLGYNDMGIAYWYKSDFINALKYLQKGLKLAEEKGDKGPLAALYGNIGILYDEVGNYSESLKNHYASLKLDEELGNKSGIANTKLNIGTVKKRQAKYAEALKLCKEALELYEELKINQGIAVTNGNIANIYELLGNYDEALKYNMKGLVIAEEVGDQYDISNFYSNIGVVYFKKRKFDLAIDYENKALKIAKAIGALSRESQCYRNLSEFYAEQGKFDKAFDNSVLYKKAEDSLFNIEKNNKITELKMQYEFEKKAELEKAEQDKKDRLQKAEMLNQNTQKKFFILIGILFAVVSIILWQRLSWMKKSKIVLEEKNRQIKEEKENVEKLRVKTELLDMRNRISRDLHDEIGSSLSSISIYSEVAQKMTSEKLPEATQILNNVGEIARLAMENMSDIVWAVNPATEKMEDIMRRLKTYSDPLMEVKNIKMHYSILHNLGDLKLSMQERRNVYLILKEAINNIAKYSAATNCYLEIKKTDGRVSVEVKDDGCGFEVKQESLGGNGLMNMQKRAAEINGTFHYNSILNNGTVINLTFSHLS